MNEDFEAELKRGNRGRDRTFHNEIASRVGNRQDASAYMCLSVAMLCCVSSDAMACFPILPVGSLDVDPMSRDNGGVEDG